MLTSTSADVPVRDLFNRPGLVQFQHSFRRALWRLRLSGKITPQQQRKYWLAAVTSQEIEYKDKQAFLIVHLQKECEKIAKASGDFLDDLSDWWNLIVAWIVENWEVILKVLLSLLVFLETPEDASKALTN